MFLALILRYKLLLEIAFIGVLAAGAVYEVHQFLEHERQIGRDEVQAKWDAQTKKDEATALLQKASFDKQLEDAARNGATREKIIHDLSAGSSNANIGLRDTLAAIRSGVPTATVDSLGKSVAALSTVFAECAGRYRDLAEKADRHASDVQTLTEAWPKPIATSQAK